MAQRKHERPVPGAGSGRRRLTRRDLIALAGALVIGTGGTATAQSAAKPYRIGMLRGSSRNDQTERFTRRLNELGFVEARDFVLDITPHHGRIEGLPQLAADMINRRPDVIVASGPEAVLKAVATATASIPIVFLAVDYDPIALGYVAGLAHPGGNLTGVFLRQVELTAKRVDLLKDTLPALKNLAVFSDAFTTDASEQMQAAEAATARLGLKLLPLAVSGAPPYDFITAVETSRTRGADAVLALMSPAFFIDRDRFVQALTAQRMPASFGLREFADLGALMSYGANIVEMNARAADYVAKIMKGATPADLPVEQPTKFELVINLKTAKALGRTVPAALLARANEVIE
jgi:putative ABC transport system substrate-binding protein